MNWRQRATDCDRRATVVYPEFVRVRKICQRLDRCYTYWVNRCLEADYKAKEEEGKITHVPKDETKDSIERAREKFQRMFMEMSKDQQEKLIKDLMEPI